LNQNHHTHNLSPTLIYIVILGCSIYFLSGCTAERLASVWRTDEIRVDGQSRDWENLSRFVMDKPQGSFALCNDEHNLYLLFHFTDSVMARMIERQGVVIWFDKQGKKKKSFGVTYRTGRASFGWNEPALPETNERDRGGDQPKREDQTRKDIKPSAPEGLAVLNGSMRDRIPISDQESGVPTAGFSSDNGRTTYEFSIPLTSTEAKYAIDALPGSVFSMGFEFAGGEPEMKQKKREGSGGDHERGPGGGGGSRGDAPPDGGGPGERGRGGQGKPGGRHGDSGPKTLDHTEIWFSVTLSQALTKSQ
jgi:hypothetical protein